MAGKLNKKFGDIVIEEGQAVGLRKLWYDKKAWFNEKVKELSLTG